MTLRRIFHLALRRIQGPVGVHLLHFSYTIVTLASCFLLKKTKNANSHEGQKYNTSERVRAQNLMLQATRAVLVQFFSSLCKLRQVVHLLALGNDH